MHDVWVWDGIQNPGRLAFTQKSAVCCGIIAIQASPHDK